MNFTEKLAVTWLTTFDKSMFIYYMLRSVNQWVRYGFYLLLVLSFVFVIEKAGQIIDIRSYDSIPVFAQSLLLFCGLFLKWLSIVFIVGVASYEALYSSNFDIEKYLKEYKSKQDFIKLNKLEKWRLRNMHGFFRTLIYLALYCFLYLFLEDIIISAFLDYYNNQPSKEAYIRFLYDFNIFMISYSIIFIALMLILDYFVRKNKRRRYAGL
mgnify:CR=1 FL=1